MRIALLCSAHGFGHVTRQLALAEVLLARGHAPVMWSAAPGLVLDEYLPGIPREPLRVDVGIAQRDSVTELPEQTGALLDEVASERAIDALAARLRGYDGAVVDIAPPALEACRRAGVPAVAVGNFDWAWMYGHYPGLEGWAERFAAWQAGHPALELTPGPGLHGFASVQRIGLVGRRRPAHPLPPRTVLVSFGGFGLDDAERLLGADAHYVLSPPMPRLAGCTYVERVAYPALVAGAALVLTKPGYGIYAEAALAGTPIAWVDRGAFPEAPSLEAALRARGDAPWDPATLEARLAAPRPAPADPGGAERLADAVLGMF